MECYFKLIYLYMNVHLSFGKHSLYPTSVFFIRIKWGRFSSLSSNVNRLPKKHGAVIHLFVLLRAKRAGYSIACKYIHIGSSIPYLLNQIGGRTRNRTNFKATKCASRNSRQPRWRIIHRKNNLSLATGNLPVRALIISSEYPSYYMSEFIYFFCQSVRRDIYPA